MPTYSMSVTMCTIQRPPSLPLYGCMAQLGRFDISGMHVATQLRMVTS